MKEKEDREFSIEEILGYLYGHRLEMMYVSLQYRNKAMRYEGAFTKKLDLQLKGIEHIAQALLVQDVFELVLDI